MRVALTTLFMAMVPVIELRGAIPYGVVEGLSVSHSFDYRKPDSGSGADYFYQESVRVAANQK